MKKAIIVEAVYFIVFWAAAFLCDILMNDYDAVDGLVWVTLAAAAVYAILYVPLEKRLCGGNHKEYNIACLLAYFVTLLFTLLLFIGPVPALVDHYHEVNDYGDNTFSGLAYNLEGIQFGIYLFFYIAGFVVGFLFKGIDSVKKLIQKKKN